jgi:hypothetical protein
MREVEGAWHVACCVELGRSAVDDDEARDVGSDVCREVRAVRLVGEPVVKMSMGGRRRRGWDS